MESFYDCCLACQYDPRCVTWSWSKSTKACALKSDVGIRVQNPDFMSGDYNFAFIAEPVIDVEVYAFNCEAKQRMLSDGMFETYIDDVQVRAPIKVTVESCEGEENTFYQNAEPYQTSKNIERRQCCDVRRSDSSCLSWNWKSNDKTCQLNRTVGQRIQRSGFVGVGD